MRPPETSMRSRGVLLILLILVVQILSTAGVGAPGKEGQGNPKVGRPKNPKGKGAFAPRKGKGRAPGKSSSDAGKATNGGGSPESVSDSMEEVPIVEEHRQHSGDAHRALLGDVDAASTAPVTFEVSPVDAAAPTPEFQQSKRHLLELDNTRRRHKAELDAAARHRNPTIAPEKLSKGRVMPGLIKHRFQPCDDAECVSGGCTFVGCRSPVSCPGGGCSFERCTKPSCKGGACKFIECNDPTCDGGACDFVDTETVLLDGFCRGGRCSIDGFDITAQITGDAVY